MIMLRKVDMSFLVDYLYRNIYFLEITLICLFVHFSAIEGFEVKAFRPHDSTEASHFSVARSKSHIIFTAETHNFPTGVAPFRYVNRFCV